MVHQILQVIASTIFEPNTYFTVLRILPKTTSLLSIQTARFISCYMHKFITGASVTTTTTASTFGLGSGPIFLSDVHCTGSEATLLDCRHTTISLGSYCTHSRDVGVRCEGKSMSFIGDVI